MMELPYGEEIMIVGRTMWTQSTSVTDGRTDRITITKTVQGIASHGKNPSSTFQDIVLTVFGTHGRTQAQTVKKPFVGA